jgi:hypothetical protein
MRKDIDFPAVEGVQVAITRHLNELNQAEWEVYLLNNNDFPLHNILVASTGYSPKDTNKEEEQQTSTLRQHFDGVKAHDFIRIELIDSSVFHLCNEYWVSYYVGSTIYDKKFVFMPHSLVEENLQKIQMLGKQGVLHS